MVAAEAMVLGRTVHSPAAGGAGLLAVAALVAASHAVVGYKRKPCQAPRRGMP